MACVDLELMNDEETASEDRALAIALRRLVGSRHAEAAVEQAAKAFGGLHVLVNGAAMRDPTATVLELDLAALEQGLRASTSAAPSS